MDLGGDRMGDIAFDGLAALSVILLLVCFYQVFKMAEEEAEK